MMIDDDGDDDDGDYNHDNYQYKKENGNTLLIAYHCINSKATMIAK